MTLTNRRQFLHGSTGLAAGFATLGASANPAFASSKSRLPVAVLGLDEAGLAYARNLAGRRDCSLLAVCDSASTARTRALAIASKTKTARPASHHDPRRLFDDPALSVVFVAGALSDRARLAALAIQAGKHVYIEMPAGLDSQDSKVLAAAASRQDRLCQAALPARSWAGIRQAVAYLQAGKLGTARYAQAVLFRPNKAADTNVLLSRLLPLLDLARWGLELQTAPSAATVVGGCFADSSGALPDTLAACYAYPQHRLVLEVRSLSSAPLHGLKAGVVFHADRGKLVCTASDSAVAYSCDGELLRVFKGSGDPVGHFLRAVRDGQPAGLHASLADGLLSSELVGLTLNGYARGNLQPLPVSMQELDSNTDSGGCFTRLAEHLAANRGRVTTDASCRVCQNVL
jgi:predicted dehydrogenase